MIVDLSSFKNDWYYPGSKLKISLWYITNALIMKNSFFPISSLKVFFLKLFGASVGRNVLIKPCVNIKYPWLLDIGNNVWIGEGVWIDNLAKVKIGNNVCLSQGAMLLCGNHNYKKINFDLILGEIILEDGVWVGAKSIVCGNVRLSSHSVLTVSSTATSNLEAYTIYQGNPAKKMRRRDILD